MEISVIIFILTIILLSFGFAGLMVRSQNRFKLERERIRFDSKSGDNSLGTGELRELIQDSVMDAISPLEERLDTVEASMRQLPAPEPMKRALDLGEDS